MLQDNCKHERKRVSSLTIPLSAFSSKVSEPANHKGGVGLLVAEEGGWVGKMGNFWVHVGDRGGGLGFSWESCKPGGATGPWQKSRAKQGRSNTWCTIAYKRGRVADSPSHRCTHWNDTRDGEGTWGGGWQQFRRLGFGRASSVQYTLPNAVWEEWR